MNKTGIEKEYFSILIDNTLTDFDRDVLNRLYLPIIGRDSVNLYNYFFSLLDVGSKESKAILHEELFKNLNLNEDKFIDLRIILEGIGLMDTYLLNNHYFYIIKKVLNAYEFFNDNSLPMILYSVCGKEKFEALNMDFLLRGHDLKDACNITKNFDEVFEVEEDKYSIISGVNTINNGINVKNANFDLDYFKMRLKNDSLIDQKQLNDSFYNLMIRYSFLYRLTIDELYNIIRKSIDIKGIIDYNSLERLIKSQYTKKIGNKKYVPVSVDKEMNEKLKYLENTVPDTIIFARYNNHLTSSEIKMFDEILRETNISVGYLNATILYIDRDKNGDIPSKNYYLKVINTWLRKGITSAKQILDGTLEELNNNKTKSKKIAPVSKWYKEAQDNQKKETPKENVKEKDEKLITIEELFKIDGDQNGKR